MKTIEGIHIHPDNEVQSNGPLDAILGNMKPLVDMLQDETNTIYNAGIIIIQLY